MAHNNGDKFMNIEQLQLVKRTKTAEAVLRFLSKRERVTNDTNLDSFRAFLIRNNFHIDKDEYYMLFKDLEDVGVGKIVDSDGKSGGKFLWKYSLKDVSEQILYPNKMVELTKIEDEDEPISVAMTKEEPLKVSLSEIAPMPIQKKRGRPPGAKNKVQAEAKTQKRRGRPPGTKNKSVQGGGDGNLENAAPLSSKSMKEIILLYTTSTGEIMPISLEEVERLIQQVEAIKRKGLI